MGAVYCSVVIESEDLRDLEDKFEEYCDEQAYIHGHGGYSGTMAEKRGEGVAIESKEEVSINYAYEQSIEIALKYGPAVAYCLGDNQWYIGAWCAS